MKQVETIVAIIRILLFMFDGMVGFVNLKAKIINSSGHFVVGAAGGITIVGDDALNGRALVEDG
ncbi:MAG TPA: hypothetical protein VN836_07600 [Verrucomicrobiae bacterium]|nr:hypothetical protein [Verrucomicrobiae bacterium]